MFFRTSSKVILLLLGVSFAAVEEDLALCKRQLTDQSYLSQACSTVSSYLSRDPQIKSVLKKAMHHLDLLGHHTPSEEGVEKQLVLNLSQEDLQKLREFVNSDKGSATDVESILIRSLEVKKPWIELPSVLPGLRPNAEHLNAGFVILFQVFCFQIAFLLTLNHISLEPGSSLLHPAPLEVELEKRLDPDLCLDPGGAADLGALVLQGVREETGDPCQARQCCDKKLPA